MPLMISAPASSIPCEVPYRVDAGGDEFVSFVQDIVGQNSDGGGAVASNFVELLGSRFDEFGADLFAEVFLPVEPRSTASATVTPRHG